MRSDLRLPGAIVEPASCCCRAGSRAVGSSQPSRVRVPVRANNAERLAELEHELRTLGNGIEPRRAARRILLLLHERDRLRGSWSRTCCQCGDSFNASRADARYCSDRCRQRARRQLVTDNVTASGPVRPVCGVTASNGQSAGQRRRRPHRARRRQYEAPG